MHNRVVIVEDEFFVANHLKKILTENGFNVVAQYFDGGAVLRDLPTLVDVVFLLDIQLVTIFSGIDVAIELTKRKIPFVFITANDGDVIFNDALATSPVAYISKPFKDFDVIAGVTLASQKLNEKVSIESGKKILLFDPEEVLYFKSEHVYVDVFTEKGRSTLRTTLKKLEIDLPENFVRCHKSYLVNRDRITGIDGSNILINNVIIPLSKTYRENFKSL